MTSIRYYPCAMLTEQLPVSSVQFLETGDLIYLMADPAEIESLRSQLGSQQEQKV